MKFKEGDIVTVNSIFDTPQSFYIMHNFKYSKDGSLESADFFCLSNGKIYTDIQRNTILSYKAL